MGDFFKDVGRGGKKCHCGRHVQEDVRKKRGVGQGWESGCWFGGCPPSGDCVPGPVHYKRKLIKQRGWGITDRW